MPKKTVIKDRDIILTVWAIIMAFAVNVAYDIFSARYYVQSYDGRGHQLYQ